MRVHTTVLPVAAFLAVAAGTAPIRPAAKLSAREGIDLPIRRVVLYKNGVGYFEHAATLTGTQAVSLHFTSAQLNDVLQTLTVLDLGGGTVAGVNYNSNTPVSQQLGANPLGLEEGAGPDDLFRALRGARVTIAGAGAPFTGRLLSLEVRTETSPPNGSIVTSHHVLAVVSDSGVVRVIELTPAVSVRLLDDERHRDLNDYLHVLATTRSAADRRLTLEDRGSGARELRVSYLSEVPVWKSTYRIVMPNAQAHTATLQGWAVVDNTVGADWTNVQLALVAGAPQSFIEPLSQPYYTRRPEIGLPQSAMTTPQTHESGEGQMLNNALSAPQMVKEDGAPPQASQNVTVSSGGPVAGVVGGIASGSLGGIIGGIGSGPAPVVKGAQGRDMISAMQPDTAATAFDDYFEYTLKTPVTLGRNQSALIPLINASVNAEQVTLWSPANAQPLRALWVTNATRDTLDRGSFSIFENGEFAGEGLTDPIHAGERRLLSYAVDQAVRVSTKDASDAQHLTRITIHKGVLTEMSEEVQQRTYSVHNAASEGRTVVLEYPVHPGWTLHSAAKPIEETPSVYRFRVEARAGETASLHVAERHTSSFAYGLTSLTDDQFAELVRVGEQTPELQQMLAPITAAKAQVDGLDRQINAQTAARQQLEADEKRLRDNLASLKGTADERTLARRYVGELNRTEDQLNAADAQLSTLRQQREAAAAALSDAIGRTDLDRDLHA